MPFVSVIVPTVRVGGLDILMDSLAAQTFQDFELVLVDAHYQKRKEMVQREAADRFLAVRHVGLNPTPNYCAFCTYSNAGIVSSTGEVLLFCVDYSRLPPGLIAAHAAFHKADPTGHAGMMGPHRYIGLDVDPEFPKYDRNKIDKYDNDVRAGVLDSFMWSIGKALDSPSAPHAADGGATVPPDADPKLRLPPGPIGSEFFHAKNESVRRARVIEVNGYDQELDGAHLYQDSDFADRLTVKAGVRWMLDPSQIVEIANPRHVFPYSRRLREHASNYDIWQKKKNAGYPDTGKPLHLIPVSESGKPPRSTKILKIAMIYGEFSSAIHGPFDLEGLYTRTGLTGSESSFFNLMRGLSDRGHEVVAFCDCEKPFHHESGAEIMPIRALEALPQITGLDVVIAWNEPDYLRFAPPGVLRICDQQLNDFGYCRDPKWRELADVWVSPSQNHSDIVMNRNEKIPPSKTMVIPNSVDLGLFAVNPPERSAHRVVYCSSPDRGLHHLLGMWPIVRSKIPDAELKVFYRLDPWLDRVRDAPDEVGRRARYIESTLPRVRGIGVDVVGLIPNAQMAKELMAASVLAYPCDPLRYTEGFGCSVLDAAAAGCMPIISDADALPTVHGRAAKVLDGPIDRERWANAICDILTAKESIGATAMATHAEIHSHASISARWEDMLIRRLNDRIH